MGLLVRDFLDDFLTLDSRFLSSMKPFITKPGFLTNEYNAGRRVTFMPPLRMYIVFSLMYFIIPAVDDPKQPSEKETPVIHQITDSLSVEGLAANREVPPVSRQADFAIHTDSLGNRMMNFNLTNLNRKRIKDPLYRDSLVQALLDSSNFKRGTRMRKFLEQVGHNTLNIAADGGKQFLNNLTNNIPNTMFFLLPIFALLIKMFYFRKKPLYVESIIFSLHFFQ